ELLAQDQVLLDLEEELGDGEVGRRQLRGQVAAIAGAVRGARVAGRMGGDADRGAPQLPCQVDQLGGVTEVAGRIVGHRVAPQREQVLDAGAVEVVHDLDQLRAAVGDADQVGHGRHRGGPEDVEDDVGGSFAGAAASP